MTENGPAITENDIAAAFGLPPESLETIDDDEQLGSVGHCTDCAKSAKRLGELEQELLACRRDLAQCQSQVEALLVLLPPAITP